ncbi:FAD-dependent oxidoreductase [Streptomyces phaeochromogenes]
MVVIGIHAQRRHQVPGDRPGHLAHARHGGGRGWWRRACAWARDRVRALLADGEVVAGDEVLVAVGSRPNTEWLASSGLPVGHGAVCDAYCEAAADIYAAGLYSPPWTACFSGPFPSTC